ncbi:thioesterase family protein [Desmospora profundinema]|uniref:Thioesterase n=1 Tax=Desmospora profundinema TaxID=1571184 RepID=A0ABU1IPQ4_9BACL|nr:hotdog domain-containing protein [Desmospora profundinema]MDR6226767.1 putative thioesterase [Desmospora profundinema]
MKEGLCQGHREAMQITVTPEMTASFGGEEVHPTLSTVTMVYYMEWVGRKIILPFLEEGEEGVGGSISVRHLAPAPVGKTVTFIAEAVRVTSSQVLCHVRAEHDKAIVGEGSFLQVILPQQTIRDRIEQMR